MNFLVAIVAILISAALQARLPGLAGLHMEFVPAVVIYCSLTFSRGWALALAVLAGLTQDALSASPYGITALAYGLVAIVMNFVRDVLDRELPLVHLAGGAFASAAASVAALCVVGFSGGGLLKLAVLALASAILTPFISIALEAGTRKS